MAIYDWRAFQDEDLVARFPSRDDVLGVDQWIALIAALRDWVTRAETSEGAIAIAGLFDRFIESIASLDGLALPRRPSRVFVSHQQGDAVKAERIAWHATEIAFEYWLDVHDPVLVFANRATLPTQIKAVLIAAIIEMGLLNSTHVIAVQTPASQHSRWVPYEFGRAKRRVPVSSRAASWFEWGTGPDPNGDYLSLAFCAETEGKLKGWLDVQPGAALHSINTMWRGPTPPPLPN